MLFVALGSAGGTPGVPVALSALTESTAIPLTYPTFAGLWTDRLNGDAKLPTTQPDGRVPELNSSFHIGVNVPFAKLEYCTQLIYSWTGRIAALKFPPNVAFPGHTLKCICIPPVAF
jgi:hypothetical protein